MNQSPSFDRQPVLYPGAPANSLAAKAPDVDNGKGTINPDRYYRRDIWQNEWDRIWTRTWHIAGPVGDLKEPGDFFTYDFMHEHFLIVMQEDRGIKAFYNVCPHRGNRLVYPEQGSHRAFGCIYHGWKFALDGKRLSIKDAPSFEGYDTSNSACLSGLRCEVHAGLVWINMDDNARPVKEALGLPDGFLEMYQIGEMVTVSRQVQEGAGNWKLALENIIEGYHFDVVHPQLPDLVNELSIQYDLHRNGASTWFVPIGEPSSRLQQQTINETLKSFLRNAGIDPSTFKGSVKDVRPAVQKVKRAYAVSAGFDVSNYIDGQFTDTWAASIFPATQIALHFEAVMIAQVIPHETDPERFYMAATVLYRPGSTSGSELPPYMGEPGVNLAPEARPATKYYRIEDGYHMGPVVNQDVDLIAKTLIGVKSRGYKAPVWGEQEQRVRHFHKEYDRYMEGALGPQPNGTT